ncbi:glutaredoxin domain-containing protein [Kineosporia sp. R_H_3]|uniref:glutaredoxin domain-containing protein n=1 Tax=Kineosporia sp. R_H_3 TaxID=1961848 RepID=UPI000B4BEDD7|nr:glutaredoxin domain-containing protein [Kineosporia sp. R_H_3]
MPLVDLLLGRPPHTPQAEAARTMDEGVTIYWRDGCPFCLRLRWAVRKDTGRATWVDIWRDPEAAAFVRTTNDGGNEVVPTVVIDGVPHTNPDPRTVVARLGGSSRS